MPMVILTLGDHWKCDSSTLSLSDLYYYIIFQLCSNFTILLHMSLYMVLGDRKNIMVYNRAETEPCYSSFSKGILIY